MLMLVCVWTGGLGLFYQLSQVAGNDMRCIDPVSVLFSLIGSLGQRGEFCQLSQVAGNDMRCIDPVSNFYPCLAPVGGGGGAFLPAEQNLLEIV